MAEAEVKARIVELFPEMGPERAAKAAQFRELLAAENEKQNLTRLVEPEAFIEGHLEDVLALEKSGFLGERALDLGSGCGVPGLLSAALFPRKWVLTESERRKAEFLHAATQALHLETVQVYPERAENVLLGVRVDTVVARAVGPVERILGWIGKCSTWNSLVLFKGPSWAEEWGSFQSSGKGKKYGVETEYSYTVGRQLPKSRVLVKVVRVPRGTKT